MPTPLFRYAGDEMNFEAVKPEIEPVFENKYLKAYDIHYSPGKHYFEASRREQERLVAAMSDAEFRSMLPDAVTCCVIFSDPADPAGDNDRLLLSYEYRYPCGNFLLSPPAGLIDPEDRENPDALIVTAEREIMEETCLDIDRERGDRVFTVSPALFSSPGMTDESNGIVCAVLNRSWRDANVKYDKAVGTEMFEGSIFVSKEQAREIIKRGRDEYGHFFSVYTALALFYFISDLWK